MSITYADFQVQLGAVLRIARKREALLEHIRQADNANYDRRLLTAANGFSTSQTDEARVLGQHLAHLDGAALTNIRSAWTAYRSLLEAATGFLDMIADDLGASQEDRAAGAIRYLYDVVDGVVSINERRGKLGALYRDMLDQSESVKANVVTFGSLTAGPDNRGLLTATSESALSHCPTGTLVLEVVSDNVDNPTLRASVELTNPLPDGTARIVGDNLVTCERSWEDGPTGITMVLTRTGLGSPTESGDNGSLFSGTTIATPAESDSDKGIFHITVTRQATSPIWLIEVFNDSARENKVGSTTADTTSGTVALTITCRGGSVISTTFNRANAHTHLPSAGNTDEDISFDIETPRLGDRWTRSLSNDEAGNFSTKLMKLWRISLPTDASPTFTDANASSISMS